MTYLNWRIGIGGVALGDDTNGKSSPQANCHTDEHVPVLDHTSGVIGEDASELAGQTIVGDEEYCLQHQTVVNNTCMLCPQQVESEGWEAILQYELLLHGRMHVSADTQLSAEATYLYR